MAKFKITYTGIGERIISKADWKTIDIDAETLKWIPLRQGHQASVVVEDPSDEQFAYFKVTDPNFKVAEVQENTEVREVSADADTSENSGDGDAEGTLASATAAPAPTGSSTATSTRGSRSR